MASLRMATAADAEALIRLRMDFLQENGGPPDAATQNALLSQLAGYFPRALAAGTFCAALAEEAGEITSCAFLTVCEKPAGPKFITGKTATLLNVYTRPAHRRRGLAQTVVARAIEEAKRLGVSSINLTATDAGKPLYEKLGFAIGPHPEMRLRL